MLTGTVEGIPTLNRLTLTNMRILFYSKTTFQNPISIDYGQVENVKRKNGTFLPHLGEIKVSSKGKVIRFKNVGIEYIDQIINLISNIQ